ncbi:MULTISPECIES: membrane protein [Protofrankia]|uniref:Integral membrane protein n=1 Tax=Candidatus Protofrankia datiscae TaxID=2716812 RepID=F8AZQ0_9ACTN|nr:MULTISPECIES: membrane protein [Protofrankia]AEH09653.1 integral membrane protein [Candidatus Protofrankia datiscae]
MTKFFLILHVLAAVLTIGPVAVAASMFPPALRHSQANPGDPAAVASLRILYRICSVYALVGVAVPALGFATAGEMSVTGNAWVIASIILTAGAAIVLALLVLPGQRDALHAVDAAAQATASADATAALDARAGARLAMLTGAFNLLWVTVTILMIVRPGSTTGA